MSYVCALPMQEIYVVCVCPAYAGDSALRMQEIVPCVRRRPCKLQWSDHPWWVGHVSVVTCTRGVSLAVLPTPPPSIMVSEDYVYVHGYAASLWCGRRWL